MTAARARSADPDTSHAAAASLAPDKIRLSQHAVLRHLRRNGPMTDTELVDTFDGKIFQSPSGLRTRRKELVDRGLVALMEGVHEVLRITEPYKLASRTSSAPVSSLAGSRIFACRTFRISRRSTS